jgi:hypothetical protein
MRPLHLSAVILISALATFACGESTDSPTSPSGAGATLNLMLKDSPFTDARSMLVTFSEVTAHRSGTGGFSPLPFAGGATSRTCDLKKLTDAQDILGTGPLPAGHYTQVRLVVSSAALYFDNVADGPACAPTIAAPAGRSASIEIPSGEVRLNRPFDIAETGATTMLIDFDGDRSVRLTGSNRYTMTPVIEVVSVQ